MAWAGLLGLKAGMKGGKLIGALTPSLLLRRIMIHQPLGGAQGQAADIEIQVRRCTAALSCLIPDLKTVRAQPGWPGCGRGGGS